MPGCDGFRRGDTTMHARLSASETGGIANRGRKLLREGLLTHHQYALLDALLWSCRNHGSAIARVSYGQLQQRAHVARGTVATGLEVLIKLGLIQKIKHRLLAIGANGGRVWKQLTSSYRMIVVTALPSFSRESTQQPDSKLKENIYLTHAPEPHAETTAQAECRRLAAARHAAWEIDWLKKRGYA